MSLHAYLPHLLPGEKVILLLRRHWFILARRLAFWALVGLAPFVLALVFPQGTRDVLSHPLGYPLVVAGGSLFVLAIWLFLLNSFVDYHLDVWVVTTSRILNIEQHQLFARTVAEQELSRVQDVTSESHGMLPTLLDYGEVHVQTAAEQARFVFEQVPHPTATAQKVASLAEMRRRYERVRDELDKG